MRSTLFAAALAALVLTLTPSSRAEVLAEFTFEASVPDSTGSNSGLLPAEGGIYAADAVAPGFHLSGSTVRSNPVGNGTME